MILRNRTLGFETPPAPFRKSAGNNDATLWNPWFSQIEGYHGWGFRFFRASQINRKKKKTHERAMEDPESKMCAFWINFTASSVTYLVRISSSTNTIKLVYDHRICDLSSVRWNSPGRQRKRKKIATRKICPRIFFETISKNVFDVMCTCSSSRYTAAAPKVSDLAKKWTFPTSFGGVARAGLQKNIQVKIDINRVD